eukprot:3523999-Prymnesium_polylepis.1
MDDAPSGQADTCPLTSVWVLRADGRDVARGRGTVWVCVLRVDGTVARGRGTRRGQAWSAL